MSDQKDVTTKTAADAKQREGETGTSHQTASKQLDKTMKDLDAHSAKPTASPSPTSTDK
jgi:hypothetical protein